MAKRSSTKSSPQPRPAPAGCLVPFFLIFLIAGCVAFYFVFLRPLLQVVAAADWPEVPCTIVSSEVEEDSDAEGTSYREKIVFQYDYQGKTYTSDKYRFLTVGTGWRSGKAKIVAQYPPGQKTVCFVDPGAPATAVLNRSFSGTYLFGLFTLIFVLIGGGGLVFMFSRRRNSKSTTVAADEQFEWLPADPQAGPDQAGPRVLRAQSTPLTALFVSLAICGFWNGIVSVFLVMMIKGFLDGDPQWFLALFLTPFVLIGLGLILLVLHSFLSLFNPRPIITMATAELWLGGTVELRWQFSGNSSRIRQLKIHLEGQEKATYRRGTTTHTDSATFAKIELVDTQDAHTISSGHAKADVPLRSMHSFKANRNEINWSLVVDGDIKFWPNVSQRFELVVLPAPVAE